MKSIIQLACLAALLVTGAGLAHADRFDFSLGSASRWMPSNSVLALHDDSSTGLGLSAAVRWGSFGSVDLLADAAYATDSAQATTFQRMETASTIHAFLAGVRARRAIAPYTSVHGRAALGMTRVSASLRDLYTDARAADHGWGASAYLGAGVDVLPIARTGASGSYRFSLGLRAELGYLATTPVALASGDEDAHMPAGSIDIPAISAALGELDMSALTLHLAVVGRF